MNSSVERPAPAATAFAPLRRFIDRISHWTDDRTAFRHRIPIRGRIALFGAGVVALAVVTFSSLVYVLVEQSLITQQDVALKARGDDVLRQLESPRGFRPSPFTLPFDIAKSSDIFVEITFF